MRRRNIVGLVIAVLVLTAALTGLALGALPGAEAVSRQSDGANLAAIKVTELAQPGGLPAGTTWAANKPITGAESPSGDPAVAGLRPGTNYSGQATFYAPSGNGNCLLDASTDQMVAAINTADYAGSAACGAYLEVHGPDGRSVTVQVTDQCPECGPGGLDLSSEAFARLSPPSNTQLAVTWRLISPDINTGLSVRYRAGSTKTWCEIQVLGARNPVFTLEIKSGSGWKPLPRKQYNYFASETGAGCGGQLRVTDVYGEHITTTALPIKAGASQSLTSQFAKR